MAEKRHPGITMHKISFGGGFIGLLFAIGSALIFVLGFPTLWYFVAFATVLGVAVAIALRMFHRMRPDQNRPLSILAATQQDVPKSRERIQWQKSLRIAHAASA